MSAPRNRFVLCIDEDTKILLAEKLRDRRLVLASSSPRRREILKLAGLDFKVVVPQVSEGGNTDMEPKKYALAQALCKLQSVTVNGAVVVAADTIVVCNGQILGKPTDCEDAARILRLLSGQKHYVYTALAIRDATTGNVVADVEASRVIFRTLSETDIADYIDSSEPLDKAGAYGIQGMGELLVDRLDGRLSNVIGLPVQLFVRLIGELDDDV
ncbi:MAG: septum formation protein Maf [candidate division Zixibacteria bacterium]|nr:septum formation protein Maf [candidate division Zixibacteria bacterium]